MAHSDNDIIDPSEPISRRSALALGGVGLAATVPGMAMAQSRHPDIPLRQLGAITGNQLAGMSRFARWLGREQDHDMIYFNQTSWLELERSVGYIVNVGRQILAQGRRVQWSVPVGGHGAYESVVAGRRDELYHHIARSILHTYRQQRFPGRICIRLPWEFNLESQSLVGKNAAGTWDPRLYIHAYRRICQIFKNTSPRFYYDWCPNIGRAGYNPDRFYPGNSFVHVVSVDVYYHGIHDHQNRPDNGTAIFQYRKSQPFGLDWLTRFALERNKLIGLAEWGVDDNRATNFARLMAAWIKSLGSNLAYHNYWDRTDGGIACEISSGRLPAIGNIYRNAFGG